MAVKILIIRFSSIGDIVLTTPVVRCLKSQLPDAEIHYLTRDAYARIPESNPYIDRVISFSGSIREVFPLLKEQKYDRIIDLHRNLRSWFTLLNLWRPFSSFRKLNACKWLLVNFKINRLPQVHIVDRYMQAVAKLGVVSDGLGLDFFIPPAEEVPVSELPETFRKGYTAFVTGGRHNTKILPAERIIDICRLLNSPVVLLGGPEDRERAGEVENTPGLTVYNACGKYNLMQSASLVRKAKNVVSNDTGLMHIAAAFQKPMVSVWGNTVPEFGMYPYLSADVPSMIAEVKGLPCRPCSKIGHPKCPKGHFRCMLDQDVNAIATFINKNDIR